MRAAASDYSASDSYLLAMSKHKENVAALIRRLYQIAANEFAEPIYAKARGSGMVTKDFEGFQRLLEIFISGVGAQKVTQISETTESQIRQTINEGLQEGLGTASIASNIRSRAPILAGVRAAIIARTETHSASQWAQVEAIRDTGLQLRKEWVAAADERTRVDHSIANGQIVRQNEKFEVGSDLMEYPGDPSASAENVINCRCVLNFVE